MNSSLDAKPTIKICLCYRTERLTIKGKTSPDFQYDKADDLCQFYVSFSLQCGFPLRNQMMPLFSQFSDNKPQQLDSNVYGVLLQVMNISTITSKSSENYP